MMISYALSYRIQLYKYLEPCGTQQNSNSLATAMMFARSSNHGIGLFSGAGMCYRVMW